MDLPETENEYVDPNEHVLDPNEPYPVVISPFHFALLSITTFGLYPVWWQFKCWRYFKEKEGNDTLPALRALLFLFFGIQLFTKITRYSQQFDYKPNYHPVAVWAACLLINFMGYLPNAYAMLGVFAFAPIILPLQAFNFYFTGNTNGYKDDKFNSRQIVLLIIGGLAWALVIGAILTGNFPPPDSIK